MASTVGAIFFKATSPRFIWIWPQSGTVNCWCSVMMMMIMIMMLLIMLSIILMIKMMMIRNRMIMMMCLMMMIFLRMLCKCCGLL